MEREGEGGKAKSPVTYPVRLAGRGWWTSGASLRGRRNTRAGARGRGTSGHLEVRSACVCGSEVFFTFFGANSSDDDETDMKKKTRNKKEVDTVNCGHRGTIFFVFFFCAFSKTLSFFALPLFPIAKEAPPRGLLCPGGGSDTHQRRVSHTPACVRFCVKGDGSKR